MDIYQLLQLLPIEVLIYKEKFENNHIIFKGYDVKIYLTNEIEKILKDNGITYSFRQLTEEDNYI